MPARHGETFRVRAMNFFKLCVGFISSIFHPPSVTIGSHGDDVLVGTDHRDTILGRSGDDTIVAGGGNDNVYGGSGNDTINGGAGNDNLHGDSGNDVLTGGAGSDWVSGGSGNDTAVYVAADNIHSHDTYTGGSGQDTLVLKLTGAEWLRADVQQDIAHYLTFLDDHTGRHGVADDRAFKFSAFGLTAAGFEHLKVVVDGVELDPRDEAVHAVADTFTSAAEDAVITGSVVANDHVPDLVKSVALVHGPDLGHLTLNADGTFAYDPGDAFNALGEGETATQSFTYRVTDADGDTDTAVVTLKITGTNDAPVATVDSVAAVEDQALTITAASLLANDHDPDAHDVLTIQSVGAAVGGSVALDAHGDVVFTPAADFSGDASFTYTASDGHGGLSQAQVTVHVDPVADAPVVTVHDVTAEAGQPVPLDIAAALTDTDGSEVLSLTLSGLPEGSQLSAGTANPDGSFTLGADDLSHLLLTPPEGATGDLELTVVAVATELANGDTATTSADFTVTLPAASHEPTDGPDVLTGTAGADVIDGLAGNDTISGLGGDDTLIGGDGHDVLLGGAGNDLLDGGSGNNTLDGGAGDDSLTAGNGDNLIHDTQGDNTVFAGAGNNHIVTGGGNDYVEVMFGDNVIDTGGGDDSIVASSGDNTVNTGAGDDHLDLGGGNNFVDAGTGNDDILLGSGDNTVHGRGGDDVIDALDGNNLVYGDGGDDLILLGDGANEVHGGAGADDIEVGAGANVVFGDGGDDIIFATDGDNTLMGGAGNDDISGYDGNNYVDGGAGADFITFGDGNNTIFGGDGADDILTGDGNNYVDGGAGKDILQTGAGDDVLVGGLGADYMTGGAGNDVFIYQSADDSGTGAATRDVIEDFNAGTDVTAVDHLDFSSFAVGTFEYLGDDSHAFVADGNTQAHFNDQTKILEVDADGDSHADMQIELHDVSGANLDQHDFITAHTS